MQIKAVPPFATTHTCKRCGSKWYGTHYYFNIKKNEAGIWVYESKTHDECDECLHIPYHKGISRIIAEIKCFFRKALKKWV